MVDEMVDGPSIADRQRGVWRGSNPGQDVQTGFRPRVPAAMEEE